MSTPAPVSTRQSWSTFLAAFVLLCGVLLGTSALDASGRWGPAILAATLAAALLVEWSGERRPLTTMLRDLGFGSPGGRALVLAAAVSGLVLLVFPVTELLSGTELRLRHDWLWLLIGIFAFHGLAEELVWRGFTFRRLRRGRSFWAATAWSMPLISASHIPIAFTMGWAVGLGAMAVAMVTSIPFAHLYETGRDTIWAPAVLHTAIDSFKLFLIPTAALGTYSALIIPISLAVPLLVLAVPRRLMLEPARRQR